MTTDTKREKYLEFLKKAATADEGSDLDDLFAVFDPENKTRAQMGETFIDALGYNPITYFDVEELSGALSAVLVDADPAFVSAVKPKRKALIDRAMEIFDVERSATLKFCLAKAGNELLSEEAAHTLSYALIGSVPEDNDFEGLEDDDDVESLTDTMKDMEDDSDGIGDSDLDDDMGFDFDGDDEED